MKATFRIEYRTAWGESLTLLVGDTKYPMEWGEGAIWHVTVDGLDADDLKNYGYVVVNDGLIRRTTLGMKGQPAKEEP